MFCKANRQKNPSTLQEMQAFVFEITKKLRLKSQQDHSRISSVGKPLACRAGRREFGSRNRTNTQGLKTTVEEDTVLPLLCKRLDLRVAWKTT